MLPFTILEVVTSSRFCSTPSAYCSISMPPAWSTVPSIVSLSTEAPGDREAKRGALLPRVERQECRRNRADGDARLRELLNVAERDEQGRWPPVTWSTETALAVGAPTAIASSTKSVKTNDGTPLRAGIKTSLESMVRAMVRRAAFPVNEPDFSTVTA